MSETASTKHILSQAGDTLSGYCLLWRTKDNKDPLGHWYTANSNLIQDLNGGQPVILQHEDIGGMLEIGTVKEISLDYYGIYIVVDVKIKPSKYLSHVMYLLMSERFNFSIATDQQEAVEIGVDGFVIRYPVTAIVLTQYPPVTGQ